MNSRTGMVAHFFITLTLLMGCTHFERSTGSGYSTRRISPTEDLPLNIKSTTSPQAFSTKDVIDTMNQLGINPQDVNRPENRIKITRALQIKRLEQNLIDDRERQQYFKFRPWFKDDLEQLEFLSQNGYQARQSWLSEHDISKRPVEIDPQYEDLIAAKDIAVGMPGEFVQRSWGSPDSVDVAGNPIYGNERWSYKRYVASAEGYRLQSNIVYFEGGKVTGWEQVGH